MLINNLIVIVDVEIIRFFLIGFEITLIKDFLNYLFKLFLIFNLTEIEEMCLISEIIQVVIIHLFSSFFQLIVIIAQE